MDTAAPHPLQRPLGRWAPLFAAIWLTFLVDPVRSAWGDLPDPHAWVGLVATVVFAAGYLGLWVTLRRGRARLAMAPPLRIRLAWTLGLATLAVVMVAALGQVGMASVVYLAVTLVMLYPPRAFLPLVLVLTTTVLVLGLTVPGWEHDTWLAFSVVAASIAVFGVRSMMNRNIELIRAHAANAALAAESERNRLARDLHDILGHSLTVITIKAELAGRLFDADPERARAELGDLERLSRDALADVRRAVEGFRGLTLPGEIARARTALAAAQIDATLPNSTDEVPTEARELFAWTVREAVTNVVRHSGARHCEVRLTSQAVEVRDDGRGVPVDAGRGSGLTGLQERAAAGGATLVTRSLEPGWSVAVVLS
ncbi:sensor histidine kinase [Nocardioides sp. L-11A]|uniref:sensor histidine kinase n=1 Tax=Nocardioides sp. L-11A TaxID=3043848 RepID=UPI00249B69E6|nr:sensor histidine kinase [Nocardioides sp. L-11A]